MNSLIAAAAIARRARDRSASERGRAATRSAKSANRGVIRPPKGATPNRGRGSKRG